MHNSCSIKTYLTKSCHIKYLSNLYYDTAYKFLYEIIRSVYISELMSTDYLSLSRDCAKHCTPITSFNLYHNLKR